MNATYNPPQNLSTSVRWARNLYGLCALLFVIGIAVQVFFAGATLLVNGSYLATHKNFAHVIEGLTLLIPIIGFFARLPRRMHVLNVLLLIDFILQYVFLYINVGVPAFRALHAVNALVMFSITATLIVMWRRLRRLALPIPTS